MPMWLSILVGPTAAEARPILAIRDAEILETVRQLLIRRISELDEDEAVNQQGLETSRTPD